MWAAAKQRMPPLACETSAYGAGNLSVIHSSAASWTKRLLVEGAADVQLMPVQPGRVIHCRSTPPGMLRLAQCISYRHTKFRPRPKRSSRWWTMPFGVMTPIFGSADCSPASKPRRPSSTSQQVVHCMVLRLAWMQPRLCKSSESLRLTTFSLMDRTVQPEFSAHARHHAIFDRAFVTPT